MLTYNVMNIAILLISYAEKLNNILLFTFCRYSNGSSHCDDYSLYSCLDSVSTQLASQDKGLPCRYNKLSH